VGGGTIGVERTGRTDGRGAPVWRYAIDVPEEGIECEGEDLAGWGDSRAMVCTLLAFLGACAESVAYARRTGRPGENEDLFPEDVAAWADTWSDELAIMQCEIEECDAME
jgi:hypothetical protein